MNYENESMMFFVTKIVRISNSSKSYCVAMALLAVAELLQLHIYTYMNRLISTAESSSKI